MLKRNQLFGSETKCETVLAGGCHMEGKLTCKGPSRIGGQIEGDLLGDDVLILDDTSKVNGNVFAASVEVGGVVNGAVRAVQRVVLRPGAKIEGEIESPSIVIDEGAQFNGVTKMSKPEMPAGAVTADSTPRPVDTVNSVEPEMAAE